MYQVTRCLKSIALSVAGCTGIYALKRNITRSSFRIVTYHGVDAITDSVINFDRLQTDPVVFTRQVETLAGAFHIVRLEEAVRQFLSHGTWPEGSLAITFDDGYRNNLKVAAPILNQFGIPATFFVTAGFVEKRITPWWYDLRQWLALNKSSVDDAKNEAVRLEEMMRPMNESERAAVFEELGIKKSDECHYPFMSVEECRELISMGFDVQCHGDTHASFSGESTERVSGEIRKSAAFVKALGITPWGLAYPYGHEPKDVESVRMVMEKCGLISAFSTREGLNGTNADPWSLNRWDLHGGYSTSAVMARVS